MLAWTNTTWRAELRWWTLALAAFLLSGPVVTARETVQLELRHTLLARQTLLGDNQLSDLNLGVKVHNRVVTLWGPVPTAEMAQRAEKLLRSLPDFLDINNELQIDDHVLAATPAGTPASLPSAPATDTIPEIGFIPLPLPQGNPVALPGSPGVLTTRPVEKPPLPLPRLSWQPVPEPAAPAATIIIQANAPPRNLALEKALLSLKQGTERYRSLQIDVVGNTVFLRGPAAQHEAVHAFSRLAARVPGVERIVVLNP